jgi:hypothetical protein
MEDTKTSEKNKWPNCLIIDIIWEWLRASQPMRLTRKQLLTELQKHGYAPYYGDLVKALVYMGKINEVADQEGGIELREDALLSDDEETQLLEHLSRLRDGESLDKALPSCGERTIREGDFYKPFADWLVKELHECTEAKPVGGNIFGRKWATPDVMGVRKQEPGAFTNIQPEIVSAEIKLNANELITAFGQACAYRLFSHKSYVVVPDMSHKEDLERVEKLAMLFGIGLITFDPRDPDDPKFNIRARAAKNEPDMYYMNDCIKKLYEAGIGL